MSAGLSPQRLAEIRDALGSVPAPPWCWIGVRNSGGPQLVTAHSGRQYLLRAAKPTDRRGDELLDPVDDAVVYGDLQFRDQRKGETYSTMRRGNELGVGRTDYNPDTIVAVANPVAEWMQHSPQYVTDLLAEVARLTAERDALDKMCDEVMTERDALHEVADSLAYAIAPIEVIGEHSSENDPWQNALDHGTQIDEMQNLRNENARLQARVIELEQRSRRVAQSHANFIYDHDDPGAEALGAQYELTNTLLGVPNQPTPLMDGYPAALPWARQMDADDLEGLLIDLSDAASGDDDLTTLTAVEAVIANWRAAAEVTLAHRTALGLDRYRAGQLAEQRHQLLDPAEPPLCIRPAVTDTPALTVTA